jgi:hypothetical protein
MRCRIFRGIIPSSPLKVNGNFGGIWYCQLHAAFFFFLVDLFFEPEDGGDISFRNFRWFFNGLQGVISLKLKLYNKCILCLVCEPLLENLRLWFNEILSRNANVSFALITWCRYTRWCPCHKAHYLGHVSMLEFTEDLSRTSVNLRSEKRTAWCQEVRWTSHVSLCPCVPHSVYSYGGMNTTQPASQLRAPPPDIP